MGFCAEDHSHKYLIKTHLFLAEFKALQWSGEEKAGGWDFNEDTLHSSVTRLWAQLLTRLSQDWTPLHRHHKLPLVVARCWLVPAIQNVHVRSGLQRHLVVEAASLPSTRQEKSREPLLMEWLE